MSDDINNTKSGTNLAFAPLFYLNQLDFCFLFFRLHNALCLEILLSDKSYQLIGCDGGIIGCIVQRYYVALGNFLHVAIILRVLKGDDRAGIWPENVVKLLAYDKGVFVYPERDLDNRGLLALVNGICL